jgi:hypothetical protein
MLMPGRISLKRGVLLYSALLLAARFRVDVDKHKSSIAG